MSHIETIPETDATGPLAELYKRGANPDGSVDNVLKAHSLNPESLRAHIDLYIQSCHRPSPVPRATREMVGVTVSRLNGCAYCVAHHTSGLERALPDARKPAARELSEGDESGLTDAERAACAYARRLTVEPSSIRRDDIEALRDHGYDDRAVLDIAQVASYFAYANRIVLGLGVELESPDAVGHHPPGSGS